MSGHPQERDEQAELVRLRNELVRVRVQTEKDRFDKETARIVLKRIIVDAGVREQASALVLGGAVGAMRTGSEISAILAAVHEELDGGRR